MDDLIVTTCLPPKYCHPNARTRQFRLVHRHKRQYRHYTAVCAKADLAGEPSPMWEKVEITYHFFHATNRNRDDDNLIASMKAARDGLVDAGVLADDHGVTTRPPVQHIDADDERVEIHIRSTSK